MSDYNDFLLPEPCLRMDTHFGDEYESVEFGDGTGYVKAAPTLARLGALYVELDELRDENAKLREQGARLFDKTLELGTENSKLRELCKLCEREAENAKLRELVTAQCECVKHDDCSECVHYSEDKCTFPFKVMHRELGIEVG